MENEKKKSGVATAAMVLGIIALAISIIPLLNYVGLILGIVAIILCIVSFSKKCGIGKAIAGIICGVLSLIGPLITTIALLSTNKLMEKSRVSTLGLEGDLLIDAALTAYQAELMKGEIDSNSSVCFDMKYLCENNYYEKGCSSYNDNYTGSVLVTIDDSFGEYSFWISDGNYEYGNKNGKGVKSSEYLYTDDTGIVREGKTASSTCGSKNKNTIYCTENGCN